MEAFLHPARVCKIVCLSAHLPRCLAFLHAHLSRVLNVLTCQHALHAYMLTWQRTLRADVLTCQGALDAYVLTWQHA